ncbi:MAG: hypothetical protein RXR17_09210 [Sulfolobaceae archaeon]
MGREIRKCLVDAVTGTVFNFLAVREFLDIDQLNVNENDVIREMRELYPDLNDNEIKRALEDVIYDIKNSDTSVCYNDELSLLIVQLILDKFS